MKIRSLTRNISLFRSLFNKWRGMGISYHKTLLFNFSAFNISTALKFPVWIYQGTKVEHTGIIKINAPISNGMIRIGKRQFFRQTPTCIINIGTMEFDGNCTILGGTTIHVLGEKSNIHFGKEVMIGENSKMLIGPKVEIGDYTRIAFGCLIMSADFHYIINTTTGLVSRSLAPIKIGKYNWIGNNSVIKKGTITPDYCIVSNGSMLTKDYSDQPLYSLIIGTPGKVKGSGYRRVYNDQSDKELNNYFDGTNNIHKIIPKRPEDPNYDWFCNGPQIRN
jgi:acetyltransferase-like isoleucine patch superfamily enzyme